MEVVTGKAAFPGIAIGRIAWFSRGKYQKNQRTADDILEEKEILFKAAKNILAYLDKAADSAIPEVSETLREQKELIKGEVYLPAVCGVIEQQKVTAAYAIQLTRDEMVVTFKGLSDPWIKKRIRNIREISSMLLGELAQSSPRIDFGEEPVILVSDMLAPSDIIEMKKEKMLAVVTFHGSEISHASIMAKTMEIPALFDVSGDEDWEGNAAIVDGYTGNLYLDPSTEMIREYELRQSENKKDREELLKLRDAEDVTRDGKHVRLYANIGSLDDMNSALYYGAAGIGLLRSEFQYLNKKDYPRENELYWEYRKVAEALGDRIAVIRTADLGADKQSDYMEIPGEPNPIMGNRGIRLSLDRRMMFKAQLRAIYRASVYGSLALQFPMITSLEEMDQIDQILLEVKDSLERKGLAYNDIPVGIMVETPAAVLIADELAKRVDFFSIGTNDLTQYTLAMDRQNPLLKDKYNDHHPAVLKMIRMTVEAAHRHGKLVYLCGEIAADISLTQQFLEMGIDALSVVPACILPVRREVRRTDLTEKA